MLLFKMSNKFYILYNLNYYMEFKSYLEKINQRNKFLLSIFGKDTIIINPDKLLTEKSVDHEILYFKDKNSEQDLIFVFGFDFFIKGLEEQEFKKNINQNSLNFKIIKAYNQAKIENKIVRVADILNNIQDKNKDSLELNHILRKLLTQAYYLGWDIKKDKNSIDNDYFIEIPENWIFKIKQRFNFDIISTIYEDNNLFMFMNGKNKIIIIFKNKDEFNLLDLESIVYPIIKKIFQIKQINENK